MKTLVMNKVKNDPRIDQINEDEEEEESDMTDTRRDENTKLATIMVSPPSIT